jgi:hypothetical protein
MSEARRVIVQYKTKPEHADENAQLVEAVYAALQRNRPDGFRYATFRLADDTFVHVASVESDDGVNPLDSLPEFAAFTSGIADRCDAPPVAGPATLVGSYRLFEPEPAAP